jgi:4-hydroxyacetophenone monooxygenase
MTNPNSELDQALEDAHLPALLMALVHMTGDAGWLRPEWTPAYQPLSPPGDTGLSEEAKADIRTKAKVATEDAEPRHADAAQDDGFHRRRPDPGDVRRLPDR